MGKEILYSEKVSKHFDTTLAVNDASMSFATGEIHGLIGENGSGKSTYCSVLCGIHPLTSGHFVLDGERIEVDSLVDANRHGITMIVQEMGTLPGLTVAENIFLGGEDKFTRCGFKNTGAMNRKAQKLLNEYGFNHIRATAMIDLYSFEDRKLVEIVKATYFKPKVVVIDETTTALSQEGRDALYTQMHRIKEDGRTIIFISHDLAEVLEHTDRISVLRDGEVIGTVNSADVGEDDLKNMMVGRELGEHYYRTDYGEAVSDDVVLSVDNVSVEGQVENISFNLHKGEILGFGGLSDCGMREVGKAIFGAAYNRTGTVALADGTEITSIPQAIDHSIAYASKDRDNESVVLGSSIRDNICLPSLDILAKRGILSSKKMNHFAEDNAERMSVRMAGINQHVSNLSGGNKQKVVLARWLGRDSDILVLDSPTRGIDVAVKADIYALMNELKEQGKSIIMISEEIQELLGMSDRIIIMKDGQINGEFMRDPGLTEEILIDKMV